MPFDITIESRFAAAHQIVLYDGRLEPLHGHNWLVRVTVERDELDSIGVVMDFHELSAALEAIVGGWRNVHLNDTPAFQQLSPTAEHVALFVAQNLNLPAGVRVTCVEVEEAANCFARWKA